MLKGDKLYGRGGADDGYAIFACLCALQALEEQKLPHARCVVMIEACEESGSYDLPYYVDHLTDRIGKPSLVVCLDSGCGDYDRLWLTTSLRGIAAGTLTVRVLTEGVHSGDASGIVPSSFRLTRALLSRLEDEATGAIKLQDLYVQIPPQRIEQAKQAAEVLGDAVYTKFPFAGGRGRWPTERADLVLNRTWRPQLAVIGMDGYPTPQDAGNVLLPFSTTKLSLRLPPTLDAKAAMAVDEAGARGRSALRRDGRVRRQGRAVGLARAGARAVARDGGGAGLAGGLRQARRLHGRRRLDPVHGHAGREISRIRSSSSPACSVRTRTRTGRTSSCTSRPASG